MYHTTPRPRHDDVQTSCNKEMSFINFVKRYGEYKPILLDEYMRVFLYFSLDSSEKTSDRDPAQSRYRIFRGKKSQPLIVPSKSQLRKENNIYRTIIEIIYN